MEIKLKYGSSYVTLPSNSITELTQEANLFLGESFYIGSTVCRSFNLGVDKNSLNSLPDNSVLIYEGSTKYADLVIDSIDDEDVRSYKFTLTDRMVRLNEQDSSWFTSGKTIQQLLSAICTQYGIAGVDTIAAYGNLAITWYDNWTARDFVSWVAELLGGYAYISDNNYLKFSTYSNTPVQTIPVANCDSFKLGEQITIDRVVYDTPGKTVKYPSDYSGTGCTLYLNTENALFTDSGNVTIENQVEYIYNVINGFSFYNVKVGKCPINGSIRAGQCIAFTLNNVTYKTIAQVNWNYNSMWLGGYELELDSPVQAETQIINSAKKTFAIVQRIDREVGEISSTVSSVETKVDSSISHISYLYGYGDSATQQPGDGAFTYSNMPPLVSGKYIWRMSLAYTNENPTSNPTKTYEMIQGAQGAQGEPGQGEPGANGYNSATIYLYKRAASTPSKPAATNYTFSTHSLSSVPSGWSITVPSGTNPLYVSTVSVSSQSDTVSIASSAWSTPQIMASNGTNGTNGTNGISYYTHIRYSANSDGSSMTSSPQANTKYIGVYTGTSSTAPTTASSYTWSKYVGDNITITSIQYASSTSGVFPAPTSGWQSSPPTVAAGNYLWTKVNYSSGDPSYSVSYQGRNGTNGTDGEDGVSVTGIDNLYYLKNARLDIVPNGNTTQKTLSGKNLLPTGIATVTNRGVTATRQTDGSYLLSGTSTSANADVYILSGEANRFSLPTASAYRIMQPTTSGIQLWLAIKRAASGNTVYNNRTFPMNDGDLVIGVFIRVATSGTNTNGIKVYPQIELGSTSTTYEQYCGGIPSPNPDYPQEIHSVSGDNEIRVVGFNVWDEVWEVGTIGNTGENYNATDRIRSKNYIPVIPNATYYYWINSTYGIYTWGYDANKNYVGRIPANGWAISKNTVTIPADVHYIRFVVQAQYGTVYKHDICINVSSSRNGEYEPYKAQVYPINLPVENLTNATDIIAPPNVNSSNTRIGGDYSLTAGTYTLSWTISNTVTGTRNRPLYTVVGGSSVYCPTDSYTKGRHSWTFTLDTDTNIVMYWWYHTLSAECTIGEFMLEKGTSTTYFPYGSSSIELNALGTYKDYFHKSDGKWYLHKAIGSQVGSTAPNSSGTASSGAYRYNYATVTRFKEYTEAQGGASSHFTYNINYNAPSGSFYNTGGNIIFFCDIAPADIGAWAQENKPIFYGILATPTETEITDTVLVAQLDNLALAISYDGGTNLLQTNSDNPFILTYNTDALTRPSKPVAEVTTSSNLPEVWSLQPATFINGYRYYNSLQVHYDNNTLTWTDVVEDSSMTYVSQQVSTMNTDIVQNAEEIALKADRSTVDTSISSLNNRVGKVESASAEMVVKADGITTTISSIEENLTDNYYTKEEITQIVDDTSASHTRTFATKTEVNGVSTEVHTMIRQSGDGIDIGKSNSDFIGHFDNDSLDFNNTSTDTTVAWVDASDGLGGKELSIGDYKQQSNRWRIFTRQNGSHLTFTRHS